MLRPGGGRGAHLHAHQSGPDLRGGAECAWTDLEERAGLHKGGQHHSEPSVFAAPGRRHNALDHLSLQQEMHIGDVLTKAQQPEQQRRRDVVGQVADDPQRAATLRRERGKVELQGIALMEAGGAREQGVGYKRLL